MKRLVPLLLAACSSGASGAAAPTPVTFDFAFTVPAGTERYACELVKLPGAPGEDVFVGGGRYRVSDGVHHFLLFRTSFDSPPPEIGQPVDCFEGQGMMRFERGYVSGGQERTDEAHFDEGLALPFHGGDVLLLQAHLLDAGATDLDVSVHVELDTVDPRRVTTKVGTLRFYDPFIVVPPDGASTATMRCPLRHDVTLLSAGSHMHARGVAFRASVDDGAPFFTTTDWEHPPFWYGPMRVSAGSSIRVACDYRNLEAREVVQGVTSADEMCMFSAFYAPAGDPEEEGCAAMDSVGTGTRSCAQTASCLALCAPGDAPRFETGDPTVGACWQRCIAGSCPNSTGPLFAELACARARCGGECAAAGEGCSRCIEQECTSEVDACQTLACDAP